MIKTEIITVNGKEFLRTFSDAGFMVARDGVEYSESVDPVDSGRVYTESSTTTPDENITGDEFISMVEGIL